MKDIILYTGRKVSVYGRTGEFPDDKGIVALIKNTNPISSFVYAMPHDEWMKGAMTDRKTIRVPIVFVSKLVTLHDLFVAIEHMGDLYWKLANTWLTSSEAVEIEQEIEKITRDFPILQMIMYWEDRTYGNHRRGGTKFIKAMMHDRVVELSPNFVVSVNKEKLISHLEKTQGRLKVIDEERV